MALDNSAISYDGSFKSRHVQPEVLFVSGNGIIDPRIADMNRQLFQLQLLMQELDIPPERTDQRIIDSLPVHKLTSLPSNPEAARCMVCLYDYAISDAVKTLPCFHMFHPDCIQQWLEKSKMCPLCKTSVEAIN